MKTITKFVLGTIIYFLIFVTAMTVIFCVKGSVPDTLIQYALGGGSIELICSAALEIIKRRYLHDNSGNLDIAGSGVGLESSADGSNEEGVSEDEFEYLSID